MEGMLLAAGLVDHLALLREIAAKEGNLGKPVIRLGPGASPHTWIVREVSSVNVLSP